MKRPRRDGFTLLELLLSLTLISLITASIMGGIHLGRRSWENSRAGEALDEIEGAVRTASKLIGASFVIVPEQTQSGRTDPSPIFIGAANGCRLVMLSEGGAQWGGLIVVEIALDSGPNGDDLAVWTKVYRAKEGLGPARETMRKTVVLEGLAGLEFSYFGAQQPGKAPTWSSRWTSADVLPALVNIKVSAKRFGGVIETGSTVAIRQQ
ncbi:MAG: prepilin-type cleavage/methylation domain-containing protein [Methylocystis sp.]|nr:MAG: prepilin-type cleavage/methylation domain-containing protein [Methylocystis sp.]